ncbi:MAG: hypothetical protein QOJ46_773 [bacterium]
MSTRSKVIIGVAMAIALGNAAVVFAATGPATPPTSPASEGWVAVSGACAPAACAGWAVRTTPVQSRHRINWQCGTYCYEWPCRALCVPSPCGVTRSCRPWSCRLYIAEIGLGTFLDCQPARNARVLRAQTDPPMPSGALP